MQGRLQDHTVGDGHRAKDGVTKVSPGVPPVFGGRVVRMEGRYIKHRRYEITRCRPRMTSSLVWLEDKMVGERETGAIIGEISRDLV